MERLRGARPREALQLGEGLMSPPRRKHLISPNEGNPQWPLRGDARGETLDGARPKGGSEKPLRGKAPVRELTGEAVEGVLSSFEAPRSQFRGSAQRT
jgi:hypothetical protein